MRFFLPLVVVLAFGALLFNGLGKDTELIPSPLINKPAPEFDLPLLFNPDARTSKQDLIGQVYLINVWASWCVTCRYEHPLITEISESGLLPVIGLNYKDEPDEAKRWLAQFGDPYAMVIADYPGRTAIDFGVYKAPESFLIDKSGTIRFKQVGPITPEILRQELAPLIRTLQSEEGPERG